MPQDNLFRDRNKIFVAGLPASVDDDALYTKFQSFGEMYQAKVVYSADMKKSRGFGFITFREYLHAMEAVERMDGKKWDGRTLNVRFLKPKTSPNAIEPAEKPQIPKADRNIDNCTTLYVGNLSYEVTDDIIRKFFSKYGAIKAIRLAQHIQTKKFRGFGYVQFYEPSVCQSAVESDQSILIGRPMHVDFSDANDAKIETERKDLERKLKKGTCHKFQTNECTRGKECRFAHVLESEDAEAILEQRLKEKPQKVEPLIGENPVCINFAKGACKRGDKCRYAHVDTPVFVEKEAQKIESQPEIEDPKLESQSENVKALPICLNYQKSKCKRGEKCRFLHEIHTNPLTNETERPQKKQKQSEQ